MSTQACSPRSTPLDPCLSRTKRPAHLQLSRSNGLTTTATGDLKQRILDGRTEYSSDPQAQVARSKQKSIKRRPLEHSTAQQQQQQQQPPPPPHMGNKPSSLHGSPVPPAADDASVHSVLHNPARVWRKSSQNLFKRFDSKSPLPRPTTATSIVVTSQGQDDSLESPVDPFIDPAHSARESVIMLPSASTTTMVETDELASQPLSASTTIKESRGDRKSYSDFGIVSVNSSEEGPPVPAHDRSTLSPTIPAPSPLPEDSPHKYGLKDTMDTPEKVPEPVEELTIPNVLNVQKARRRSSGLEIFNVSRAFTSFESLRTNAPPQEAKTSTLR